jgi:AAA+ ATPase superfamily predicted ATPase
MSFTLYPVTGHDFVGRKSLVSELTTELRSKNRMGYSLSGIRRVGKTSILKEVKLSLERRKLVVIYISAWRILPKTVDQFTRILTRAAIAEFRERLPTKFRFEELLDTGAKALGRLLSSLKLSAKVSEDLEVSLAYVRRESDDVEAAITKSFTMIEHLAEMTRSKCVLMLDEFPSLVELTYGEKNQKIGEGIIQLLRTLVEDFRYTKLVVSGSYRDTLSNLVAKQKSPFYRQLLLRQVNPFDRGEYQDFLSHYLPRLEFKDEDVKKELYNITSGIPFNLHLLGKEIKQEELNTMDKDTLTELVSSVLREDGDLNFMEFMNDLSPSEIKTLTALSQLSDAKPVDIAKQQYMENDTVNRALSILSNRGLITRAARGVYRFTDNLFAEWLRTTNSLQNL